MAVTVEAIKGLAAGEKISAGRGVYFRMAADGSVSPTLRVKRGGKSKDITLDRITDINKASVRAAFTQADKERGAQAAPAAPTSVASKGKKAKLAADATLGDVWTAYLAAVDAGKKWQPRHRKTSVDRVNKYLRCDEADALWNRPISSIDAADIADLLAPIRAETPMQADKIRSLLSITFTHAVDNRVIAVSPVSQAGSILRNTTKAVKKKNFPTLTDWAKLRDLYRSIENSDLEASVRNCLKLQALTMTRSGEVVGAHWDEFDLEEGVWVIPRARMKVKDGKPKDHVLHLSTQTTAWLRQLKKAAKGKTFLFPGRLDADTISLDAPAKAMRTTLGMGGVFVPHSWRSACSTLAKRAVGADGRPLFHRAWVEQLLDHEIGESEVEGAYDRGEHFEEAGRVLQWWSDKLLSA